MCKAAYFVGYYGKAASGLACARGFNGGVEGQQISLFSNLTNDREGFRHPATGFGQLTNSLLKFAYGLSDFAV